MLERDPEDVTTKTLGQVNKYCTNKRDTLKKLGCSLLSCDFVINNEESHRRIRNSLEMFRNKT